MGSRMLTQQFWNIFEIKYLCNDWSNHCGSNVFFDQLYKFFHELLLFLNANKSFSSIFLFSGVHLSLNQPYCHTKTKGDDFRNASKSALDLHDKSFICTKFQAFNTFSAFSTCTRGTMRVEQGLVDYKASRQNFDLKWMNAGQMNDKLDSEEQTSRISGSLQPKPTKLVIYRSWSYSSNWAPLVLTTRYSSLKILKFRS